MTTATRTTRLFNPAGYEGAELDPASARLMRATIGFFEAKGKDWLLAETTTLTSGTPTFSTS